MKLSNTTQLGIHFCSSDPYREKTINIHKEGVLSRITDEHIKADAVKRTVNLINNEGNRQYLFSKKALAIVDKIKIDEKLEPDFFNGLRVGKKVTILLGNKFIRYHVIEGGIMIFFGGEETRQGYQYFSYTMASIYTDYRNTYSYEGMINPLEDIRFNHFLKMLIFLEFSDTILEEINPGKKTGSKASGKILNSSKDGVVFVDSKWNVTSIRVGEFLVSGHLRLQRVGKARGEVKLIYIQPFSKDGYMRQAKSETLK